MIPNILFSLYSQSLSKHYILWPSWNTRYFDLFSFYWNIAEPRAPRWQTFDMLWDHDVPCSVFLLCFLTCVFTQNLNQAIKIKSQKAGETSWKNIRFWLDEVFNEYLIVLVLFFLFALQISTLWFKAPENLVSRIQYIKNKRKIILY